MDVKLPKLGEGADSGVVVTLLVNDGDEVSAGQTLLELENEKAVAPIPAPVAGKVSAIRVKAGDRVSVGQVLMTIGGAGQGPAPTAEKPAAAPAKPAGKRAVAAVEAVEYEDDDENEDGGESARSEAEVAAAPSIRRMARELGIDLARIRGSERGGRIVLADVRNYIVRLQKQGSRPAPATSASPSKVAAPEAMDFSKWGEISKKPLSPLRKVISQRMTESWTTIPHVTQFDDADVTALDGLRKKYSEAYAAKGARLTLTSFVLKAVATTLKQHPLFNASLDEAHEEIVFKEYVHLGIAVDTEAGLLVPVIRDADKKDLVQLSKELAELAVKARDRKVSLEELKGGTFTISNQGGIGSGHFTPIVNKPEVAILGLGRGAVKPVFHEGKVEPRLMLPLALSYDHRLIDGGKAARFMVDLVKALEGFGEGGVKAGTE